MGLPGDTEESIQKTSDYALSLELDDMNMSKFTPFHGAPIWSRINEFGTFEENWRKMNCINFVFVPREIDSTHKTGTALQHPCKALLFLPAVAAQICETTLAASKKPLVLCLASSIVFGS